MNCSAFFSEPVSPHVCRHATAIDLLHHGVDRSVIALWLGHESVKSTQMYLHADMCLKEKALSRTAPFGVNQARYRPCDKLLSFLESL
jgi:site-specific recombinase XerD